MAIPAPRARPRKTHCFTHVQNSCGLSFEVPRHPHTETGIQEVGFCLRGGAGEGGGGALSVKIHPPLSSFRPLNHSSHTLPRHLLLPSSWNCWWGCAFREHASAFRACWTGWPHAVPRPQERWEGCSRLLWGTAEAAAGPGVRSGGGSSLFGCGEGQGCRRRRYHPQVWRIQAEGLCIHPEFLLAFFFCMLEFLKFLVQLKLALRGFFLLLSFVCSTYYQMP